MPKRIFTHVKLPITQPDNCFGCPLLGQIPKHERQFGSQETFVCLATHHAMSARIARSRASEHTTKHPLKRPCDTNWERWQLEPYFGKFPVRMVDVNKYRDPFVRDNLEFHIIFHDPRGRKKKNES
jgi:hypothetical protein